MKKFFIGFISTVMFDETFTRYLQEVEQNKRLISQLQEVKKQNEMMYEAFHAIKMANEKQQQANKTSNKNEGTDMYEILMGNIVGAKKSVQEALDVE